MSKVLTVVVPAYQAATYLPELIPTLVAVTHLEQLEILIVNDGSTDETSSIAHTYEQAYPEVIRVIDKANGGHGSTINAGIQAASGKYFKVVDADDWVDSQHFSQLIDFLGQTEADEVIAPFYQVFMHTGQEVIKGFEQVTDRTVYPYSSFLDKIGRMPEMHAITIKTEILRDHQIVIDEGMFYVDMEYNLLPMPYIKEVAYFALPVYRYRLGTANQSVSAKSYLKHKEMHYHVLMRLVDFYMQEKTHLDMTQQAMLKQSIQQMMALHLNIYLSMPDIQAGKAEYQAFCERIEQKAPEFNQDPYGRKAKLLQRTHNHLFGLLAKWYQYKFMR